MDLYEEFFLIVKTLNKKKVRFALVGGLALAFYDRPRFTRGSKQDLADIEALKDDKN